MNPHLEYGQFVPGKNSGQKGGLIDVRDMTGVVDAVGLLAGSPSWSKTDQKGMETWFSAFLDWMTQSKLGQEEGATANNHGVWYDVQVASYALFVGRKDVAARVLKQAGPKRIAAQIEPDGSMPLELKRTRSFTYCMFNLDAFFSLATLGTQVGVDLWNYQSDDGRSLHKAVDYMVPYLSGSKKWEREQITKVDPEDTFPALRRAAIVYRDPRYEEIVVKLQLDVANDRANLLYPLPKK
jgi:hypothetical protein